MLRLFCLFNSITSGPLLSCFILLSFLSPFIILFVFALFHTFTYVTLFTINTSVITLQKKKNPIPGTCALRISSCLSIACSQALLQLAFFHRLPHLWLSTVLLKVHHFISLRFSLFALHFAFRFALRFYFAFVTIPASRFGSHRHCHKPRLALRFWPCYNTHTHTLSLSLSHTFSLRPSLYCTVSPLGFTSHTSASRHTSRLHVTHLGLSSRSSATRHTSPLCITHLGFSFSLWFFILFLF